MGVRLTGRDSGILDRLGIEIKYIMAEREGFEPSKGCPFPTFEAGAFNRSATSPFFENIYIIQNYSFLFPLSGFISNILAPFHKSQNINNNSPIKVNIAIVML